MVILTICQILHELTEIVFGVWKIKWKFQKSLCTISVENWLFFGTAFEVEEPLPKVEQQRKCTGKRRRC